VVKHDTYELEQRARYLKPRIAQLVATMTANIVPRAISTTIGIELALEDTGGEGEDTGGEGEDTGGEGEDEGATVWTTHEVDGNEYPVFSQYSDVPVHRPVASLSLFFVQNALSVEMSALQHFAGPGVNAGKVLPAPPVPLCPVVVVLWKICVW